MESSDGVDALSLVMIKGSVGHGPFVTALFVVYPHRSSRFFSCPLALSWALVTFVSYSIKRL